MQIYIRFFFVFVFLLLVWNDCGNGLLIIRVADPDPDPDPVGSGMFCPDPTLEKKKVGRFNIFNLKEGGGNLPVTVN